MTLLCKASTANSGCSKPKRKRVHVHAEGEALTNDEVMELLRYQEKEKNAKEGQTKKEGPGTSAKPVT